jgi:hypothetical protein
MVEGQNHGLIGDPITVQLDARKTEYRGHLNQGLLHGRVADRIPLLQLVDAEQCG